MLEGLAVDVVARIGQLEDFVCYSVCLRGLGTGPKGKQRGENV